MSRASRVSFIFLLATLLTLCLSPGNAAVLYYNDTDTGYVGKGDVQSAYGWNNKQMQENFDGVAFSGRFKYTVTYDCISNQGIVIERDFDLSINSTLHFTYKGKNTRTFSGYLLYGNGGVDLPDDADNVRCPGNVAPTGSVRLSDPWLNEFNSVFDGLQRTWKMDELGVWVLQS